MNDGNFRRIRYILHIFPPNFYQITAEHRLYPKLVTTEKFYFGSETNPRIANNMLVSKNGFFFCIIQQLRKFRGSCIGHERFAANLFRSPPIRGGGRYAEIYSNIIKPSLLYCVQKWIAFVLGCYYGVAGVSFQDLVPPSDFDMSHLARRFMVLQITNIDGAYSTTVGVLD